MLCDYKKKNKLGQTCVQWRPGTLECCHGNTGINFDRVNEMGGGGEQRKRRVKKERERDRERERASADIKF